MTFLPIFAGKVQLMRRKQAAPLQPGRLPLHPLPRHQGQILGVSWGRGGIIQVPAAFYPYPWELTPPYRVLDVSPGRRSGEDAGSHADEFMHTLILSAETEAMGDQTVKV